MPAAVTGFAESALGDPLTVQAWYAEQGVPAVGIRLVDQMLQCVQVLADPSDMGRVVPEFEQPFPCELIHPPFRIVSRRDPGQVRVVRLWRSESMAHFPD